MVANHYRWDFIGLSTDEKPTPATSEKVVDGSTFYCSDNSKLYVFCGNQWYEKVVSGGGEPYVLPIASADTLGGIKVGDNLSIDENGVLSGVGGGEESNIFWLTVSQTGSYNYVENTFAEIKDALDAGKTLAFHGISQNGVGGYGKTLFIAFDNNALPASGSEYYIHFLGFGGWDSSSSGNINTFGFSFTNAYFGLNINTQTIMDNKLIRIESIAGYNFPTSANATAGDYRLVTQNMLVKGTGVLSNLTTTNKTSLVNAINELVTRVSALEGN